MPSVRSVEQAQYYAHPQNSFWPILASVYAEFIRQTEIELWQLGQHSQLPFARKQELLRRAGISLWDVLASCQRQNSADSSICKVVCNPVASLLAERPRIWRIFLNGQKSAELFQRHIQKQLPSRYHIESLPSTSPAHARLSLEAKRQIWAQALKGPLPSKPH